MEVSGLFLPFQFYATEPYVESVLVYAPTEVPAMDEPLPENVLFLEAAGDEDLPAPRSPSPSPEPHAWDVGGRWVGIDETNVREGRTRSDQARLDDQEPTLGERLLGERLKAGSSFARIWPVAAKLPQSQADGAV